jgi:hypothetical protein
MFDSISPVTIWLIVGILLSLWIIMIYCEQILKPLFKASIINSLKGLLSET